MILYYAVGGGLGHLTRAKAFLDQLGFHSYTVITASPSANMIFLPEKLILIPKSLTQNLPQYRIWIKSIISDPQYDQLIVDTFPNGVIGELLPENIEDIKVNYVTRRLKWDAYVAKITPILFDKSYILEELENSHHYYIQRNSKEKCYTSLNYPSWALEKSWQHFLLQIKKPIWLIIHSENKEELNTLISFAYDKAQAENIHPYYLVITNQEIELKHECKVIQYYPAWAFYPYVQKVFTACGFNSYHIPVPDRVMHHFIPFARKYDDQFWRARQIPKKIACQ